jgi:phosphoadenylyl-sulfate reductase (thioredoxin)
LFLVTLVSGRERSAVVEALAREDGPAAGAEDPGELKRWSDSLAGEPAARILALAAQRWPDIRFSTAFGPEGCVLVDLIARHQLPVDVFTLDTGLLFPETHALWQRLQDRYRLTIRAVRPSLTLAQQAVLFGERLWERDPDRCCALRKVEPLRGALAGAQAWVTSIRRDQTKERATAAVAEWDERFSLVKINPLAHWTAGAVWAYLRAHDVPVNALHERGYASIGCQPCTTPVAAGEGARAGRWRGHEKTECGLHSRPRPAAVLTLESPAGTENVHAE